MRDYCRGKAPKQREKFANFASGKNFVLARFGFKNRIAASMAFWNCVFIFGTEST
jgi:hypothetical protein